MAILAEKEVTALPFETLFPVWDKLTPEQQRTLKNAAVLRRASKGTVVHDGAADCLGYLLVRSGQLRAYFLSEEGREITLYRLFERDACLLAATCMMPSIQFDVTIEAEKDSEMYIIGPETYKSVMKESAAVANYTNEIMSTRLSDVMWLMEQVLFRSFDRRLAGFLVEESELDGTAVLKITHEKIANHLGTAREVVTRMLRYFQEEGMVHLTRGTVELTDVPRLKALQNA